MFSEARFDRLSATVDELDTRIGGVEFALEDLDNRARGGIAAAMAMSGTMIVPDANVSFSLNASTFQGEQGFSGAIAARLSSRLFVSASLAGSSVSDTTGARLGVAMGF